VAAAGFLVAATFRYLLRLCFLAVEELELEVSVVADDASEALTTSPVNTSAVENTTCQGARKFIRLLLIS
jgi:hypothetical protein